MYRMTGADQSQQYRCNSTRILGSRGNHQSKLMQEGRKLLLCRNFYFKGNYGQ